MIRALSLSLAASLLAACVGTTPIPQRLYQLSATVPTQARSQLAQTLGIGPLQWPDYLKTRKLVLRLDAHRISLLENDRWAEALDTGFDRALRENLARQLQPPRLQGYPWSLADAPAIQVPLEVLQFDSDQRGETVLRARWRIVSRDRTPLAAERNSDIRIQARDGSATAAVIAQSDALAKLAAEIGLELAKQP